MKRSLFTLFTIASLLILSVGSISAQNNLPGNYDWEAYQDSLRNEILNRKENKLLKESFLQEMYIRNVVHISDDSLFITIPFNLHFPFDCGAPDCFSTDVSFSFKPGNSLAFPEEVQFTEHEHGCVEEETTLSGSFFLMAQDSTYVIYHSPEHKRTLALFRTIKNISTWAYYFTKVEENSVSGENIYKIEDEYDENDVNAIYPFKSTVLSNKDYERFLE